MALALPTGSSPGQEPVALWSVQSHLLSIAETILGPRDGSKTICQPTFTDCGPKLRNTPNLDGAFAELSRNAQGYWPTVVNELAHETVHLLNPKPGVGTWLEEGIAVAFSIEAQRQFNLEPQDIEMPSYRRALRLVSELTDGPLVAGRRVREACWAYWDADQNDLVTLFPTIDPATLSVLCNPFERDWPNSTSS